MALNPNSCTEFTSENGNDVLLDDRRADYFNEEYNLCEEGCKFIAYNETIEIYICNCSVKSGMNDEIESEFTPMDIPDSFYKKEMGYSNIKIFKLLLKYFH